jgi:hypothetical protein
LEQLSKRRQLYGKHAGEQIPVCGGVHSHGNADIYAEFYGDADEFAKFYGHADSNAYGEHNADVHGISHVHGDVCLYSHSFSDHYADPDPFCHSYDYTD